MTSRSALALSGDEAVLVGTSAHCRRSAPKTHQKPAMVRAAMSTVVRPARTRTRNPGRSMKLASRRAFTNASPDCKRSSGRREKIW